MLIEARAVELSNGSEVAAHARGVLERRARLFSRSPAPIDTAPPIVPAPPSRPIPPFISDDAYAAMLQWWVGNAARPPKGFAGRAVCRTVAQHFKVPYAELLGPCRQAPLIIPRHIAMYICVRVLRYSFPETGRLFRGRDHSTVVFAVRKIAGRIGADPAFATMVNDMIRASGAVRP